ncbi:MAG: prolipoprotein diacylglyceryl transferase [Bacteroidetes bacterium]|nr:prolipoprotein diacylglyceryl transferase [Bacteroidota bacterium]
MYPELFKVGPFTVYSYGLMMGIAFIIASYILTKEFERRKLNPSLATEITLLAIIFGIIGSKALDLIENWDSFIANPLIAFSPGGLTFYGGLILAIIAIAIYIRKKKIPFLVVADATSPSLILAYGIGRIGCQLAGDGDYGIPTSLPWGTNFANGTVKPHYALSQFYADHPALALRDNYYQLKDQIVRTDNYGSVTKFDEVIRLHPAPIYEFILCGIIFLILWSLRKKYPADRSSGWADGQLFMAYLIFAGVERLSIEFIRLNPLLLFGLSEAQLISIVLIIVGVIGFVYLAVNKDKLPKFVPPPLKVDEKKH